MPVFPPARDAGLGREELRYFSLRLPNSTTSTQTLVEWHLPRGPAWNTHTRWAVLVPPPLCFLPLLVPLHQNAQHTAHTGLLTGLGERIHKVHE